MSETAHLRDTLAEMRALKRVLGWLKSIPAGLWAALGVGLTILGMYLRNRKLHADLAQEQVRSIAARAKANAARHRGKSDVYREQVAVHEQRIEDLEKERKLLERLSEAEDTRIATMPEQEVTERYLELTRKVSEK